jgi:tetratricopeptide (TPR) repeat protein
MKTGLCARKEYWTMFRTIVLLVTALPAFPQPHSRRELMTPWLKGDPNGTHQLLVAGTQVSHILPLALRCAAEFETERGNYAQARLILTKAKDLDDRHLLKRREAKLRSALGDFAGAEKAALDGQRWDGLDINKLKVSHPLSLNALGEAYAARGLHEQAIAIFEKSLKVSRTDTEDRADWVEAKVLRAFSRVALNDFQGALADAEEALSFARKHWGGYGPRTLDAADALGVVLVAQGKFEEADQWLALVLRSRQNLYQYAHPKTAASFLHSARLLAARKNYAYALEFTATGLSILQAALPEENARTAFALAESAEIYQAAGRHTEAREKLETGLRFLAIHLGDDAPSVQALNRRLATVK